MSARQQRHMYPSDTMGAAASSVAEIKAEPKIIGLVAGRNEAVRLAFCLRALSMYADAIVYLDDCSEDNSVALVQSLAAGCRVERILRKDQWYRDEPGDRNRMLAAGREIGGTHFVVLDADEAFTSNCKNNNFLRRLILSLLPGDSIAVNWIQLWRDVGQYRLDDSVWTWNYKGVIFCDDGNCEYRSAFLHTPRVPSDLSGHSHRLSGYAHGLMHFQFVNWRSLLVKQAWYRCLERVRDPQKPTAAINQRYAATKDEHGIRLRAAPTEWFIGYPFFDVACFNARESWREKQIRGWFEQFGTDYFQDLDIWDIDWTGLEAQIKAAKPLPSTIRTEDDIPKVVRLVEAAAACQANGDLIEARDAVVKALDWAPSLLELLVAVAELNLRVGNPSAARWYATLAELHEPENTVAHMRLAESELALKRFPAAAVAIERVFVQHPDHPSRLQLFGELYFLQGRFAEASIFYRRVLEQIPSDITVLLRLGSCCVKTQEFAAARATYKKVLRHHPGHRVAKELLAALESG